MTFSTRFDPFIQAVARQAENVYTKMAIRRDESENFGRKKQGENEAAAKSIPWEDTTDVSIMALRGFLEDLLGVSHSGDAGRVTSELPLSPMTGHDEYQPPPPTVASHAARAYRTTGRVVHDENVTLPPPFISTPSSDLKLGDDFGDTERDMMRGYIADLTALEKRGITHLTLRRSLTFLESIHQAIENTK